MLGEKVVILSLVEADGDQKKYVFYLSGRNNLYFDIRSF